MPYLNSTRILITWVKPNTMMATMNANIEGLLPLPSCMLQGSFVDMTAGIRRLLPRDTAYNSGRLMSAFSSPAGFSIPDEQLRASLHQAMVSLFQALEADLQ